MSRKPIQTTVVQSRFRAGKLFFFRGYKEWKHASDYLSFDPKTETNCSWTRDGLIWQVSVAIDPALRNAVQSIFENINAIMVDRAALLETTHDGNIRDTGHEYRERFVGAFLPRFRDSADKLFDAHYLDFRMCAKMLSKAFSANAPDPLEFEEKEDIGNAGQLAMLTLMQLFLKPLYNFAPSKENDVGTVPEEGYIRYLILRTIVCYAIELVPHQSEQALRPLLKKVNLLLNPVLFLTEELQAELYSLQESMEKTLEVYKAMTEVPQQEHLFQAALEIDLPRTEVKPGANFLLGHIVHAFDKEIASHIRTIVNSSIDIKSDDPVFKEPVINRLFANGQLYYLSPQSENVKDDHPLYTTRSSKEGVFFFDIKGSTRIVEKFDTMTSSAFLSEDFYRPLAAETLKVKEHFNPKDYTKWLEPLGSPGDAWYMRGDIISLFKVFFRLQKVKNEFRMKLLETYEKRFGVPLSPEEEEELNLLQGGAAVTYSERGNDAPIPELGSYVYQSSGVYHMSRFGERTKSVLNFFQQKMVEYEKTAGKQLPFNVFIREGEIYNNGFLLTKEAVEVLIKEHCSMLFKGGRQRPLVMNISYPELHEEIRSRYGFCPEMDTEASDEDFKLRFIVAASKEDASDIYYIRHVGTAKNMKNVARPYDVYECIPPSEDHNSFWWLLHKHHGIHALRQNEHKLV